MPVAVIGSNWMRTLRRISVIVLLFLLLLLSERASVIAGKKQERKREEKSLSKLAKDGEERVDMKSGRKHRLSLLLLLLPLSPRGRTLKQ